MKKRAILFGIFATLLCGCSFSENQRLVKQQESAVQLAVEPTKPTGTEQKITTADKIILEENEKLIVAKGDINEVFCFLPGYKKIPVAKEEIKVELEQIFVSLEKAEKRIGDSPLLLDGAGLAICYDYEEQEISLKIYSAYGDNSIMVSISGGGILYNEILVSAEAFQFVHEVSGWKEFDLAQLNYDMPVGK